MGNNGEHQLLRTRRQMKTFYTQFKRRKNIIHNMLL